MEEISQSQFMSNFDLFINNLFLKIRSRNGFLIMLCFFRLCGAFGILITRIYPLPITIDIEFFISILYILLSIIFLFIVQANNKTSSSNIFQGTSTIIDALFILYFLYCTRSMQSEIYLLLLLPLISVSHYFSRKSAIFFTTIITLGFGLVQFQIHKQYDQYSYFVPTYLFILRSSFILFCTWVYRFSRRLPGSSETYNVGPTKARELIESKVNDFKSLVDFDSASVQLLYKDRLCIIACEGFENKEEIYKIEFPVDDPSYPNCEILNKRKGSIHQTDKFDSFRVEIFAATNIKQWLAVPLISPATNEILGMLTLDSKTENKFNKKDLSKAYKFARILSDYITNLPLGPAALTQNLKSVAFLQIVNYWKKKLFKEKLIYEDDFDLSLDIVNIAKEMFYTEDCSIFFLKQKYRNDGQNNIQVLHLIASTSIPPDEYSNYESPVNGRKRCGLTGHSLWSNQTLNLSAVEVNNSPHHSGKYTEHLKHLESRKTKQLLITPIRDHLGIPIGVLKLENKKGWPSDSRFPFLEEKLFEAFCYSLGLTIENIRIRNFYSRQRSEIHSTGGLLEGDVLNPISEIINQNGNKGFINLVDLNKFYKGIEYVGSKLKSFYVEPIDDLALERYGVLAALECYVTYIYQGSPNLSRVCNRVFFHSDGSRDNLSYNERCAFYRFGREAILNALKHSNVENIEGGFIRVTFKNDNEVYHLEIEDNGRGFDKEYTIKHSSRYGSKEMIEQVEILKSKNNEVVIEDPLASELGKGTIAKLIWKKKV